MMKNNTFSQQSTVIYEESSIISDVSTREEVEGLIKGGRLEEGVEALLKEMLYFLGGRPVDKYHDYRDFRHRGLVDYLVNRFMRERWNKKHAGKCGETQC